MTMDALDRLVGALVEAQQNLPGVLADWENLDDELRATYAADTEWLLRAIRSQMEEQQNMPFQTLCRVYFTMVGLGRLGNSIQDAMGFRPEEILSIYDLALPLIRASAAEGLVGATLARNITMRVASHAATKGECDAERNVTDVAPNRCMAVIRVANDTTATPMVEMAA